MPFETPSKVRPLPTLEQLQDALNSGSQDLLQPLRQRLDWNPPPQEPGENAAPETGDPDQDRLRRLINNFGPGVFACMDKNGNNLLHLTAYTCTDEASLNLVRELLGKKSLQYFGQNGDSSVVQCAAWNPCNSALKWLVRVLGPDCLRGKDECGNFIVHTAARYQGADSMQLFRDALGAACFKSHCAPGFLKRSVFHSAACNTKSNEALMWLIKEIGSDNLTVPDEWGNTPVHLAAWMQGEDSMKDLKEILGDKIFTLPGQDGETVVHSAAQNTNTNSALVYCIKELGPLCMMTKDCQGRRPVHHAAQYQNEECLKMTFLSRENNFLTSPDAEKRTAVHYAAMNVQTTATLRWIVAKLGPECLTQPGADGCTALHVAALYQKYEMVNFIKNSLKSADLFELKCINKRTMAHYAAMNADHRKAMLHWIVKELGRKCLQVPDANGMTPAKLAGEASTF